MSKQDIRAGMFYDIRGKCYWLRMRDRFVPFTGRDCTLHLKNSGLSHQNFVGNLTEIEKSFLTAQTDRAVDYAAPLAGHDVGSFLTPDGRRVLVTSKPRLIEPKRGKWDNTQRFFDQLLNGQRDYLEAWLRFALESLEAGDFRPGQIMCLAGEAGCGKSYLQWCITQLFGGRSEDPLLWLRGDTKFNAELAEAEHWRIDDPGNATRADMRRTFGDALKRACINREISIHGKGAKAITLPLWRRITMSVNKEVENITALPPLDESMKDKVMLLMCSHADLSDEPLKNQKWFLAELPAIAYAVRNAPVPKSLRCPRMGIQSYHHAELVEALTCLAPEQQLIEIIDEHVFANANYLTPPFVGSAEKLKQELLQSPFRFTVEKLLYYSSACGVYLERLTKKHPARVSASRVEGKTRWKISPPGR